MAGQFCDIRAPAIASKRREKAANLHLDGLRTMENAAHRIGSDFDASHFDILSKAAFCHHRGGSKQGVLPYRPRHKNRKSKMKFDGRRSW
jgi:hypothetical protein